jgi:hypothetical protein
MFKPIHYTTATLPLPKSITRSPLRRSFLFVALALALFALSPQTRAADGAVGDGTSTAEGTGALAHLTTGLDNTATGFQALSSNTAGTGNTASGYQALQSNTTVNPISGDFNTASGFQALQSNTTGGDNTATGSQALGLNTTGGGNTATGVGALFSNTTGGANTATGISALGNNNADANTATGDGALNQNLTGNNNTASGASALFFNATGSDNTAEGFQALENSTGSNNIALGSKAGTHLTTGSNNIDIGALGVAGEANTIRIGRVGLQKTAYMQGISGVTVASGVTVIVGSNGHLGTVTSSERFKEAIKPMDKASEAILQLRPVIFRYKEELDPDGIPQFGLIAEQVEKVNPDLVVRDDQGKVNTVRYEAVNAMLLNEFLKEHRKVEEQEVTIAQLKSGMEALTATLNEQASQIQKVNARLELSKAAPQIVAENQ